MAQQISNLRGSFTFVRFMVFSSSVANMPAIRKFSWLLQIRPNYIDQFFGGLCSGESSCHCRGIGREIGHALP